MNWNSTEFIWLDWLVLTVGVIAIVWAVYRAIKKDQEKMKGADSQDYLFGKGEPWYIIGAAVKDTIIHFHQMSINLQGLKQKYYLSSQQTSVLNTL